MPDSSLNIAIVVGVVAYLQARGAGDEPARIRGDVFELRGGGWPHRLILHYLNLGIFVLAAHHLYQGEDQGAALFLMTIYPFGLLSLPRTIRFNDRGIRQRSWHGKKRCYAWSDIGRVISDGGFGKIMLYSKVGDVVLEHTRMHTGYADLRRALGKKKFHVG